jgi:hypothetical protein
VVDANRGQEFLFFWDFLFIVPIAWTVFCVLFSLCGSDDHLRCNPPICSLTASLPHSFQPWRCRQHVTLKCWYPISLYGFTIQKTVVCKYFIIWRIDPLLCKDFKTNNKYSHCCATGE